MTGAGHLNPYLLLQGFLLLLFPLLPRLVVGARHRDSDTHPPHDIHVADPTVSSEMSYQPLLRPPIPVLLVPVSRVEMVLKLLFIVEP
jgi:hypothetical protein